MSSKLSLNLERPRKPLSFLGSVWGRLLASFVLIGGILSVVTVLTLWQFAQVQNNISDLVQNHIPDIALANELAASATQLSNVATALAEPQLMIGTPAVSQGYKPILDNLRLLIGRIDDAASAEQKQLVEYQENILSALDQLTGLSERRQTLEATINQSITELRWLQSDFQSEVSPLLQDLSFNIDNAANRVVNAVREEDRELAALWLARDRGRRDVVQEIGSDGAFAVNAILQGAAATNKEILNQFVDIAGETLDSLDHHLADLGEQSELITLKQTVISLKEMVSGDNSVLDARFEYIITRDAALQTLGNLHNQMAGLQGTLTKLGVDKREAALLVADYSAEETRRAGQRIMSLAVLGLIGVVAIMWFYVRKRITMRLKAISQAMRAIARGETDVAAPSIGGDEIGRMARAIEVFRKSVIEREENLQRLQVEISEREKAVQELHRAQNDLVQAGKLAALGQLSAGISHELNQPITAIRYAAHNALVRLGKPESDIATLRAAQSKALDKIVRVSDRMGALVKQFSRFARRADFESKPVALALAVEGAIDLFHPHDGGNGMPKIIVDAASFDGVKVMGDTILIEQILVNLVSNARDSIRAAASSKGEIRVFGRQQDEHFVVEIVDDGAGLPDISQSVFDPFVTTKEAGDGTGLGLSISYSIAQDLGGFLTLENRPGAGAQAILGLKIASLPEALLSEIAE